MAPTVLTGRRRVRPRLSVPAAAPSLRLSFGMLGFPFAEPAFATLVPPGDPLAAGGPAAPAANGVVHVISSDEWRRVCETEGVGSRAAGYQVVEVDCIVYPRGGPGGNSGGGGATRGPALRAVTLQGAEASLHSHERRALPSERYLNLLREGEPATGKGGHGGESFVRLPRPCVRPALPRHRRRRRWRGLVGRLDGQPRRLPSAWLYLSAPPLPPPPGAAFHGLDPVYQAYLDSLEPYSPGGGPSLARAAGALAAAAVTAAAAAPALPLLAAVQLLDAAAAPKRPAAGDGSDSGSGNIGDEEQGRATAAGLVGAAAGRVAWAVHDAVLEPALGSGCRNGPLQ
jgi:hypothetical protein